MKINLTDQELNEWVAINVMGWHMHGKDAPYWADLREVVQYVNFSSKLFKYWNPCENLNDTHLMEENIREMGKADTWWWRLRDIVCGDYENSEKSDKEWKFDLAHASARQRVEAAYLTFEGFK